MTKHTARSFTRQAVSGTILGVVVESAKMSHQSWLDTRIRNNPSNRLVVLRVVQQASEAANVEMRRVDVPDAPTSRATQCAVTRSSVCAE